MKKYLFPSVMALIAVACAPVKKNNSSAMPTFDFEAHRGGRGLMPENTIPAMRNAVGMEKVQTLEMDVVITKDGQVLVSHDPYFNANITTTPEGKYLTAAEGQKLILYQLNYNEIKKYDVGIKPHPDFARQQKIAAQKPLLADLVDAAEAEAKARNRTIHYNIEIKSKKTTDNTHHPEPAIFTEKLIAVLKEKNILERCIVQSFDMRPLQELHKKYPAVKTSFLIDKDGGDKVDEQLAKLGFTPTVYSPVYTIVTQAVIDACHRNKMQIVPWTVNTKEEIQKLVDMNADGVISDYPDLFNAIKLK
jgi:glycerophosphoryl diester phosphodiesterase